MDDGKVEIKVEHCVCAKKGQEDDHDHVIQNVNKDNLCGASPYFKALFYGGFSEGGKKCVTLSGVSGQALEILLESIQTHSGTITSDSAFSLLQASGMLQFEDWRLCCVSFILDSLSEENALLTLRESYILGENDLYNKALQLSLWTFDRQWNRDEFLELPIELVKLLLDHEHLSPKDEFQVFSAISVWLEHDLETRGKCYYQNLLQCLRFDAVSDQDIKDMLNYSWVQTVPGAESEITNRHQSSRRRRLPKFPCVVGQINDLPHVLLFDPEKGRVEAVLALSSKLTSSGTKAIGYKVAASGLSVWILGGEFGLGRSNWNTSVWRYSFLHERWQRPLTLDNPRRHLSVCVTDDHEESASIYLTGGFGKHRIILNTVERITEDETIEDETALPEPLYNLASFWFRSKLYVVKDTRNTYVYDNLSKQWSRALSHVNIPNYTIFTWASVSNTDGCMYATRLDSKCLLKCSLLSNGDQEEKEDLQTVGSFKFDPQNVCVVDDIVYSFSFDPDSQDRAVIESYSITTGEFQVVYKAPLALGEDDIKFASDFTAGCFPLIHYPKFSITKL